MENPLPSSKYAPQVIAEDVELIPDGAGFWVARPSDRAPGAAGFDVFRRLDRVPRAGDLVGPYRILAEIGRGGLGVVFRARDERTHDEIALKTIHEDADELDVDLLEREAELAARVSHPGVVAVRPLEVHDRVACVPMELLWGESLDDRLARGPLPAHEVAAIVCRVASALSALHEARVLHCDLSPANVLLVGDEEEPRLIDFSAASEVGVGPEWILGTPPYMAPEQTTGADLTERTDVYGLGALLYRMLCGEPPHRGETIREVFAHIADESVELPGVVCERNGLPRPPLELSVIAFRCLAKEPASRPASAAEVAEELARWLEGERADAAAAAPPVRTRVERIAARRLEAGSRHAAAAAIA